MLDALGQLVRDWGIGFVVVDNASDVYDDDEIRRARVRTFIRSLRSRIARPGRAVLLLAHVNKLQARFGKVAGSEAYSGSTAWHNSVRSRLKPRDRHGGQMTIEHAKANLGPKAPPVRLEWLAGVPMAVGSGANVQAEVRANAERERDAADKLTLAAIITDFDRRGERVTTAMQGPYTVFKLLKAHLAFPRTPTPTASTACCVTWSPMGSSFGARSARPSGRTRGVHL